MKSEDDIMWESVVVVLSASEDSELRYVTMFACESVVLCARSFGTRVHGTKNYKNHTLSDGYNR